MDMRDFLNAPNGLSQQTAVNEKQEAGSPQSPLGGRMDVFDLPFHMARDQIEGSLRTKMASIKARMIQLQDAQKGAELTSEATERQLELETQLVEARSIIQEQASVMSKHFTKPEKPRRLSSHLDAEREVIHSASSEEKYTWPEDQTSEVKHVWEQIFKRRFSSMLNQARTDALKKAGDKEDILEAKGHGPIWIALDVWDRLVDIWSSSKWKDKSEAARKNRMTEKDGGITKHTSGSITFSTQKKEWLLSWVGHQRNLRYLNELTDRREVQVNLWTSPKEFRKNMLPLSLLSMAQIPHPNPSLI